MRMRCSFSLPRLCGRGSVSNRQGSALLMVLWLTAALAAIGLTVASTVRGETERTETSVDDARSWFEARGGDRARRAPHLMGPQLRRPGRKQDLLRPGPARDGPRFPFRGRSRRHHPRNVEAQPEQVVTRRTAAAARGARNVRKTARSPSPRPSSTGAPRRIRRAPARSTAFI